MTDPVDRLAALRPVTDADHGWAQSPAGRLALSRIHHRASLPEPARPRRPRGRTVVLAVAATLAAAGVASAATVSVTRDPVVSDQAWCLQRAEIDADSVVISLADPTPDGALTACSAQWTTMWPNDPVPAAFTVCLYPVRDVGGEVKGGGQAVIPVGGSADPDATCVAAGFDPVAR